MTANTAVPDTSNPYQSPPAVDRQETWWTKLRGVLRLDPSTRKTDFPGGDAIICCGIAYFINLKLPSVLYASSPSSDLSQERMNLVVAESIRVLPIFLAEHPELHPLIRGRRLTVQITNSYSNVKSNVLREVELEWEIVDAILSTPPDDSPMAG